MWRVPAEGTPERDSFIMKGGEIMVVEELVRNLHKRSLLIIIQDMLCLIWPKNGNVPENIKMIRIHLESEIREICGIYDKTTHDTHDPVASSEEDRSLNP